VIIPDGPKTAGYTRSWCVYLGSTNEHFNDNTNIWIRDDRRKLVRITGSHIEKKLQLNKNEQGAANLEHGTIYSPRGCMAWKKKKTIIDRVQGDWCRINQIVCATKKTWRIIQNITTYPQGPIFEDYFFSLILYEAGFNCSDLGRPFGIHTPSGLESIARPDDTGIAIIECPYNDEDKIRLAIQMARGIAPAISFNGFDSGFVSFTITIGDEDRDGANWIFTNRPGAQGGGQTHTIAMLYMLQQEKNTHVQNVQAQLLNPIVIVNDVLDMNEAEVDDQSMNEVEVDDHSMNEVEVDDQSMNEVEVDDELVPVGYVVQYIQMENGNIVHSDESTFFVWNGELVHIDDFNFGEEL